VAVSLVIKDALVASRAGKIAGTRSTNQNVTVGVAQRSATSATTVGADDTVLATFGERRRRLLRFCCLKILVTKMVTHHLYELFQVFY